TFGNYNGKGPTAEQAMASAVMEAMERYCCERRESDTVVHGTYEEALETGPAVYPPDLILSQNALASWQGSEIAWVRGYDLFRGSDVWVPACAAFYPYYPDGDMQLMRFNTNGLASGNTIEEAILHSLFELIERDAWSIADYHERSGMDVIVEDPESVPGRLLRRFSDAGVEISLKDLTSDIGITTIGAAADDVRTKDPEMLTIGVGTHLDPEIAAVRALTEVAQSRASHRHGLKVNAELRESTLKLGYDRIKALNPMWYRPSSGSVRLSDMESRSTPYVLDDIELVLSALMDAGFDSVIAVDFTRPELGVPTVRMIVPGLEVYTMDAERVGGRLDNAFKTRKTK
ncbi:MAG: YcaO-like family protein, partial [Candidatus Thermoplasmatota archaeon]|nr:YcaO-like family protein [Candidatus Thermoplasmatota archaeon]